MHDLNGRELTLGCRVRAATSEELRAKNVNDPPAGFSGEKVVVTGNPDGTTCNVNVVDSIDWPAIVGYPAGGGTYIGSFKGSFGYATARTLIRID